MRLRAYSSSPFHREADANVGAFRFLLIKHDKLRQNVARHSDHAFHEIFFLKLKSCPQGNALVYKSLGHRPR